MGKLRGWMNSLYFANFMVAVVIADACCTSAAIDARASSRSPSQVLTSISDACLILYSLEASILFWLSSWRGRLSWMMLMDILIVSLGWMEKCLELIYGGLDFNLAVLRPLRLVRIFRILRSLKRNRSLRELHKLATMMATCFRTLAWSFLLCFVVMTVWAMLMVELIYPWMREMGETKGPFSECMQCQRAMSSVMDANLLLFRTVIAGDSWGDIAVPMIQEHPETAIIFVGSMLTLVFGVVNLIVAVVVDTFAEARQNDVLSLAEELEDDMEHDRQNLIEIFQRIDKDNTGELTLEELIRGAREDSAFHSRLRIMDIDEDDLQQLFHMIDQDDSGTVELEEFVGPLSRWAHDSKTAPRFIKYNMLQSMHLQQDLYEMSMACFQQLSTRMDDLAYQLASKSGPLLDTSEAAAEALDPDDPGAPVPVPVSPKGQAEAMARAKHSFIELGLEKVLHNLEAKLDLLMGGASGVSESRVTSKNSALSYGLGRQKRPMRPILHRETFQSMYMNRRPRAFGGQSSPLDTPGLGASLGLSRRTSVISVATDRSAFPGLASGSMLMAPRTSIRHSRAGNQDVSPAKPRTADL